MVKQIVEIISTAQRLKVNKAVTSLQNQIRELEEKLDGMGNEDDLPNSRKEQYVSMVKKQGLLQYKQRILEEFLSGKLNLSAKNAHRKRLRQIKKTRRALAIEENLLNVYFEEIPYVERALKKA